MTALAIKPLALLGTILFASALLGGQPVQDQDTPAYPLPVPHKSHPR